MKKRFRYLSLLISLMVCFALVGIGVYAASTISPIFSAEISFTPTRAYLQMLGYIDGLSIDFEDNVGIINNYYGANYNNDGEVTEINGNYTELDNLATFNTWSWGDLILDAGTKEQITNENNGIMPVGDMVIYLQITNFVNRDVEYKLTMSGTLNAGLTLTAEYYLADNSSFASTTPNGFWGLDEDTSSVEWSKTNKPTYAPVVSNAITTQNFTSLVGSNTNIIASNTSTALKTIMIKLTISANNNFNETQDLNAFDYGFVLSIV